MKYNKHTKTALAAVIAVVVSAVTATQVFAASDNATTNAEIIGPITITNTANLEFGNLAPGTAITVFRITSAGVRSVVSGDGTLIGGGTVGAAAFDVTGSDVSYDITYPASIALTGPGTDLTVDTFTDSKAGVGTITSGTDDFTVGADVTVAIGQTAGAYTGILAVTVNYQ